MLRVLFMSEPNYLGNTWQECRQIARDYLADAIAKRDAGEHRFADEYLSDARRMLRVSLQIRVRVQYRRRAPYMIAR